MIKIINKLRSHCSASSCECMLQNMNARRAWHIAWHSVTFMKWIHIYSYIHHRMNSTTVRWPYIFFPAWTWRFFYKCNPFSKRGMKSGNRGTNIGNQRWSGEVWRGLYFVYLYKSLYWKFLNVTWSEWFVFSVQQSNRWLLVCEYFLWWFELWLWSRGVNGTGGIGISTLILR